MIKVNLLPLEYRKAEATPLKQFFATVGAVVLAAMAATIWAWVFFAKLEPAREEVKVLENEIAGQKGGLEYTKKLETRVKDLQSQYRKIDEVAKSRVVWSRKIDEIWELVVNPKAANRYEVWLKSLSCKVAPTKNSGGSLEFAGTSAGSQVYRLADFHEDVATSPFYADFQSMTAPYGLREPLTGEDRDPKEGWTFNFSLALKSLEDISKSRKTELEEAGKK